MRVLHIFDHSLPLQSGYSFRSRELLLAQRRRGWETCHVTTPRHTAKSPDTEAVDGLEFHRTRPATGWTSRIPLLTILAEVEATVRRVIEVGREFQPDILHAHSPALCGMAALKAGRALGLPVAYEVRGTWEDAAVAAGTTTAGSLRYILSRRLESHVVRGADAVFVICEGLRTEFLARGVPAEKLQIIPNAVDSTRFVPSTNREDSLARELGLEDAEVVAFLGSFYAYEGLDDLIKAMLLLVRTRPKAKLLLVGGGPEEAGLRALVDELALQDRVVMTGRVPNANVDRYYSLADVLAFPRKRSRITELVTPLKPLEALAQGKLVVVSSVGGHRELITDGETGILFEPDDPSALALALDSLFGAPHLWDRLRRNGLEFVRKERTWDRSAGHYTPTYERLLRPRRAYRGTAVC